MPQTHLVLVGTSLLRNAYRELQRSQPDNPCTDAVSYCVDPHRLDRSRCRAAAENPDCMAMLRAILARDPYTVSAELNAMKWILDKGCPDVAEIILYPTDTPESLLAASLLQDWLSNNCPHVSVKTEKIGSIGEEFWPTLLQVFKRVSDDASEAHSKGRIVYLNATGGFKPESAAALLAAAAAAPVTPYYIHEAMKNPVILPYIPLTLDKGRLNTLTALLRAAAQQPNNTTICATDKNYEPIAWIIHFLADGSTCIKLDQKTKDILETIAGIYDALASTTHYP